MKTVKKRKLQTNKYFTMYKLEIKLKGFNKIISMKYMFAECQLLESIPDIINGIQKSYWNESYV